MDIIPQVSNNTTQINSAEFVKLKIFNEYEPTDAANITSTNWNNYTGYFQIVTVGNTDWTGMGASSNTAGVVFKPTANGSGNGTAFDISIHTFSSSYKNETIPTYAGNTFLGNITYLALGGLLQVGAQNRNIRVTSGDTSVALSGISGNNISTVLGNNIRGSELEILRGFYDANSVLTNTYPRFTGIITNYNITEDREADLDNFTVTVSASSYKTVLENRIAGRKTNKESWRFFNSNDSSMDNVYSISGVQFDFGQDPKGKYVVPGGGGYPGGPGGGFDDFNMDDR